MLGRMAVGSLSSGPMPAEKDKPAETLEQRSARLIKESKVLIAKNGALAEQLKLAVGIVLDDADGGEVRENERRHRGRHNRRTDLARIPHLRLPRAWRKYQPTS